MREGLLLRCVRRALEFIREGAPGKEPTASAFVGRVLSSVRSPREFSEIAASLDEEAREDFVWLALKSYHLDPRVVVHLIEDETLMARVAPSAMWCEDALWVRARIYFEELPGERFEIVDLVPDHLPSGVNARSLLGAALDGGRLTDRAIDELRRMYPRDQYIQSRTRPSTQ